MSDVGTHTAQSSGSPSRDDMLAGHVIPGTPNLAWAASLAQHGLANSATHVARPCDALSPRGPK